MPHALFKNVAKGNVYYGSYTSKDSRRKQFSTRTTIEREARKVFQERLQAIWDSEDLLIEHNQQKLPDIILFVNGLPLRRPLEEAAVVIKLKNPTDEATNVESAFRQIKTYQGGDSKGSRYAIPTLFTYNAICVASDGLDARAGTITPRESAIAIGASDDIENVLLLYFGQTWGKPELSLDPPLPNFRWRTGNLQVRGFIQRGYPMWVMEG